MTIVRGFFLAMWNSIVNALRECSICYDRGVEDTSLRYPEAMCTECSMYFNEAIRRLGTTAKVEEFITAYGKREFRRFFGGFNTNPMYESEESLQEYDDLRNAACVGLKIDETDNIPCDEVPCFDTFPAPRHTYEFVGRAIYPNTVAKFD